MRRAIVRLAGAQSLPRFCCFCYVRIDVTGSQVGTSSQAEAAAIGRPQRAGVLHAVVAAVQRSLTASRWGHLQWASKGPPRNAGLMVRWVHLNCARQELRSLVVSSI